MKKQRLISFIFFSFLLWIVESREMFSQGTNISGVVNTYTPVTLISNCSVDVVDASSFSVGNRVMIIQMKGTDVDSTSNSANFGDVINLNACGNYEFAHVSLIMGNTIFFTIPLIRSYSAAGTVQLIKVPQYTNANITAPITCPIWNGTIGGVIVIECSGILTFNANIDCKSKGFNFGNVSPTGYSCPGSFDYFYPSTSYFGGEKGEGISVLGLSRTNGMGKRANGGGGGNNVNAGGGGGGNLGMGGNGGYSWEGCPIMDIGGRGGQPLTYSNSLNKVFLGGGGGGGQQNNLQATAGTNGGGIVILRANNIVGNSFVIDVGALNTLTGGCDGAGGGGAGGTVLLDVTSFTGNLTINANGGNGSATSCYQQGASGGGGGGCVWSKIVLPNNVSTNFAGGIRGIHGTGSQDGLPGDTLSGLTIVGTPFAFVQVASTLTSASDSICLGSSSVLTIAPNGVGFTYSWLPALTLNNSTVFNPIATPLTTTTYSVTLTYPSGCKAIDTVVLAIKPAPFANFGSTKVCNGSATLFTDSSTTSSGIISSRTWDFGDGSAFSTTQNPSHIYANPGNYNATLIVNNSFGCADTITKLVKVYYNPTAGFSFTDVCLHDTTHFINTSSVDVNSAIASYLWVFGDGSATSNLISPSHYYSSSSTFTVTLVATTTNNCSDVANNAVKVFDPPMPAFTFSNVCLFDTAIFINTSINPASGTISSCIWNFGNGSAPVTLSPPFAALEFLYSTPGNYPVTLIVQSSNLGCADTLLDTITVYNLPTANFGFSNVCLNQPITFNDSSHINSDTISAWSWNFGDSSPLNALQDPSHIYLSSGANTVSLVVTSNHGCKDSAFKNSIVHPLPTVQFSKNNVCDGNSASFIDLSGITATDTIQSQTWDFGDGSSFSNIQNPSHLYPSAGYYATQLLVVSKFGCVDSLAKTTIVNPNPVVNYTAPVKAGCETFCVNFQDSSFILTGNNVQWSWNFGDGSSSNTSQDLFHCYLTDSVSSPQFFTPVLTVTSDSGCVGFRSKNNYVTVYPNPQAGFKVQPSPVSIITPVVSITDLSTGTNFWYWNFGDNDTTSKHHPPSHTYPDTGSYTITLITSNVYGCFDTAYQAIIVTPDFEFYIPNSFSPNDDGINDGFLGKGVFIKEYMMTIFDRWGNLIFYSDDINKSWNGKANQGNEIAQADVYVYVIELTDFQKNTHTYRGTVNLIR